MVDPAFTGDTALTLNVTETDYVTTNMFSRTLEAAGKGNHIFTFTKRGATAPLTSNVIQVDVK